MPATVKDAYASERLTVGTVEDVMIMPWKIVLPARIDTGAATSSLDARDVRIEDKTVTFRLAPKYSDKEFTLPIIDWKTVRSAAAKGKRPVVELELCVGSKLIRTRVNLNDRSGVKYPMLLGRNTLTKNFVVDCTQTKCTVPSCTDARAQ